MVSAQRLMAIAVTMAEKVNGMTTLDRMRESQGNLRATNYDGAKAKVSTVSDPTSSGMRDSASRDLRNLDRYLTGVELYVADIERTLDAYGPARPAADMDRLALERMNIPAMPGCVNCARIEGPRGGVRWEPVDTRHPNATTVGDRLPESVMLCSWCYDAVAKWGRLPSVSELEKHHRGEKVPWPADVPRLDEGRGSHG